MGSPKTRATLILRIRDSDDQAAWNEFVEIYTPLIYNFAMSRGLQAADSRDVLQVVLQNIFRAIPNFHYDPQIGTFRSWLYTIARNEIHRSLGKSRRTPFSSDPSDIERTADELVPGDQEAGRWELDYRMRLFQWAMDKVQPEFAEANWQAFLRTAIEEEDPSQVAADLNTSRAAVYVSRSRVLKRIRAKVAEVSDDVWENDLIARSQQKDG